MGALTSKPYAFQARPWELVKTEFIDVMDAVGTNIRVDSRGREVMRILPRVNEAVNEEWISDKTRHVGTASSRSASIAPMCADGKLVPATWDEAFAAVAKAVKSSGGGKQVGAIAGDLAAVEDMYALKPLMTALGSGMTDVPAVVGPIDPRCRAPLPVQPDIAGIEDADAILIVGSNPRKEAPLRQRAHPQGLAQAARSRVIGDHADLTYAYEYLGEGLERSPMSPPAAGLRRKAERPPRSRWSSWGGRVSHGAAPRGRSARGAARRDHGRGAGGLERLRAAPQRRLARRRLDIGFVPHDGGLLAAR